MLHRLRPRAYHCRWWCVTLPLWLAFFFGQNNKKKEKNEWSRLDKTSAQVQSGFPGEAIGWKDFTNHTIHVRFFRQYLSGNYWN